MHAAHRGLPSKQMRRSVTRQEAAARAHVALDGLRFVVAQREGPPVPQVGMAFGLDLPVQARSR